MKEEMTKLKNYNPTKEQRVNSKDNVLNNAKKLVNIRSSIIKAFEDGIFPLSKEDSHKNQAQEEEKKTRKKEETIPDQIKVGNHTFRRIRERVNNYVNKGLHNQIGKEVITMNPVICFSKYSQWKV